MTSQTAAAPARLDVALDRVRHWWRVASEVRPIYVLGPLLGVQWIAVLALALTVRHNGWLYYAGGDQLWHYTGADLLAHGHLPADARRLRLVDPAAARRGVRRPEPRLCAAGAGALQHRRAAAGRAALHLRHRVTHRGAHLRLRRGRALGWAPVPRHPRRPTRLPPEVHRADAAAGARARVRPRLPVDGRADRLRLPRAARSGGRKLARRRRLGPRGRVRDRDQAVERALPPGSRRV